MNVHAGERRPRENAPWSRWSSAITPVDWLAVGIIVVQLVVRTSQLARGYWYADDFRLLFNATRPFSWDEAFIIIDGHLSTTLWLLPRLTHEVAPGSFTSAVVLIGLLQAIAASLVYLVLRRVFGPRPLVLVLLVWFAFSTLTLGMATWASVAFSLLPFTIASAAAVLLLVRYLELPTRRRVAAVTIAVVAAMLCYERAVALPLLLFVVAAWFPILDPAAPGAQRTLIRHRALWIALGTAAALYSALYVILNRVGHRTEPPVELRLYADGWDLARLLGRMLGGAFATSLFGGPWQWGDGGNLDGLADPPPLLAVLASALLVFIVVSSWVRRPVSRWPWVFLFGYLLASAVLLAFGRLGTLSFEFGGHYRYIAGAALPAVLVLGLALVPTRAEARGSSRQDARARRTEAVFATVLGVALLLSATVSSLEMWDRWSRNDAREFVTRARDGFEKIGDAGLLFQPTPPNVLGLPFAHYASTEVLLSPYPGSPAFTTSVPRLFMLDKLGNVRRARIDGWSSLPGPDPSCGWPATSPSAVVLLEGEPFHWTHDVRLTYRSERAFTGSVALGDGPVEVPFERGEHDVFTTVPGRGSELRLADIPPDADLCIRSATVGSRVIDDQDPMGSPQSVRGTNPANTPSTPPPNAM